MLPNTEELWGVHFQQRLEQVDGVAGSVLRVYPHAQKVDHAQHGGERVGVPE